MVVATVGNGIAIVCNQVLIQRGAPDRLRGRAIAVLMSTTYATMALAMAGAGLLVNAFGGRVVVGARRSGLRPRRNRRGGDDPAPTGFGDRQPAEPEVEPLVPDGSHIVERIKTAVGS